MIEDRVKILEEKVAQLERLMAKSQPKVPPTPNEKEWLATLWAEYYLRAEAAHHLGAPCRPKDIVELASYRGITLLDARGNPSKDPAGLIVGYLNKESLKDLRACVVHRRGPGYVRTTPGDMTDVLYIRMSQLLAKNSVEVPVQPEPVKAKEESDARGA